MVAARWAKRLDRYRGRLIKLLADRNNADVNKVVDLLGEVQGSYDNVAKAGHVQERLDVEVVPWFEGGLVHMGQGQWATKVQAVVREAEKLRNNYDKECDKEWRTWAARSLEGGA
eukprot:306566-Pyramimonas_sp.AAC.1